jgi:hypothetical protein
VSFKRWADDRGIVKTVFTSLLLLAASGFAADTPNAWHLQLASIDAALQAQKFVEAQSAAKSLTEEMFKHVGSGPNATYTFATALAFRAIAEAGVHNFSEADWHWRIAVGLFPTFEKSDLSIYGEPGIYLMTKLKELSGDYEKAPRLSELGRGTRPPKIQRKVQPVRPGVAQNHGVFPSIMLQVVVGTDGAVHDPKIINSESLPSLVYSALNALREWRFTPATLNDHPIAVAYEVTVTFLRYDVDFKLN